MQPLMRKRVRAHLHAGGPPLVKLRAAHERFSFLQKLCVPAIVRSDGAAHDVTRGCKAIASHERRCRREGVGVSVIKRDHNTTARAGIVQPGDAFACGDAPQTETAQRPQLPLEPVRAHVQQLEACVLGRRGHVVVTENRKRRHEAENITDTLRKHGASTMSIQSMDRDALLERVARWLQSLVDRGRRSDGLLQSAQTWEAQYAAGRWDFLAQLSELSRFSVLAGYVHQLKPGGAVLDVGCGQGVLLRRLPSSSYARYLGIDMPESAIAVGRRQQNERSPFLAVDCEDYSPAEQFDV